MPEKKDAPQQKPAEQAAESNRLLQTQLFVCLFWAAVIYFAWRQGGPLWGELSRTLREFLQEGVSFSGQEELTRLTDEVRDFFGNIVETWLPLSQ